jgi:hypothetical protein
VAAQRLTLPQVSRVSKSAGKVLGCPEILVSRRHHPHWLSSKVLKYQHGVLLITAGKIEGHFEGKTLWEFHQSGLVLAWYCTGYAATCNAYETGLSSIPVSRSSTLFSGSDTVGLPPVLWTEKKFGIHPF